MCPELKCVAPTVYFAPKKIGAITTSFGLKELLACFFPLIVSRQIVWLDFCCNCQNVNVGDPIEKGLNRASTGVVAIKAVGSRKELRPVYQEPSIGYSLAGAFGLAASA